MKADQGLCVFAERSPPRDGKKPLNFPLGDYSDPGARFFQTGKYGG